MEGLEEQWKEYIIEGTESMQWNGYIMEGPEEVSGKGGEHQGRTGKPVEGVKNIMEVPGSLWKG